MTRPTARDKQNNVAGPDKDAKPSGQVLKTKNLDAALQETAGNGNGNGDENGNGERKKRSKSLVVGGTKYLTQYNKKFENRVKWMNPDRNMIFSIIPGTVIKVFVNPGDKVSEGDSMIILEAMKMRNKVLFPREGTISKVRVREGEKIPRGHLIIEMED